MKPACYFDVHHHHCHTTACLGIYSNGSLISSFGRALSSISGTISDPSNNATSNPTLPPGHNIADSKSIIIDATLPICSIKIENGAAYALSATVNLNLSAFDANGISQMRFSENQTTWTAPEPYASNKEWTLPAGDGTKKVVVKFKDNAGNRAGCSDAVILDTTVPTGSIKIKAGASYTTTGAVPLTLSAADANGMAQMQFSNDNTTWTIPEAYATSKAWTLTEGDGTKTVHVKFQDKAGNWSIAYSTTIILDSALPSGDVSINNGDTYVTSPSVTITLSAYDTNDVRQMKFSKDNTTWTTPETYKATKSWTLSLGDGTKTVYVKFKDEAGNWSAAYSDTIILVTTPPTGSINIENGAAYASSSAVTLNLSATDANGVSQMQFSADNATWTAPEAYAATKSWTLPAGDGPKTVYVKFQDNAGNWSTVRSDAIILDTALPTGSITINGSATYTTSTAVTLTLSASDTNGISQMQFSNDNSTWTTPQAYSTSKSWTLSSGNGTKTVYVKFKDKAGKWSDAYSDSIILDTIAPKGSVVIKSGDVLTTAQTVTLTLSPADINGVTQMKFSNNNVNWKAAEPFAASKSWTLTSGNGVKTVYAMFKDTAGNWSAAKADTITFDTIAPTGSIKINKGAVYATSAAVTLNLSASDTNGVTQMKFSNDGVVWSSPQIYATTKSWILTSGSGLKTVSVMFKNKAGNWSDVFSDTITLSHFRIVSWG